MYRVFTCIMSFEFLNSVNFILSWVRLEFRLNRAFSSSCQAHPEMHQFSPRRSNANPCDCLKGEMFFGSSSFENCSFHSAFSHVFGHSSYTLHTSISIVAQQRHVEVCSATFIILSLLCLLPFISSSNPTGE